jgi:hypothetical protein
MWTDKAAAFLSAHGFTLNDVKTGVDAWAVAHRSGITKEAYEDANVYDAHIQTALERIFPNAVFKDKKVY